MIVSIEARDFTFAPTTLTAPAGEPFRIAFSNADAAVPHNVMITTDGGVSRFSGKIIMGESSTVYVAPALVAGTYRLGCIVHPSMTATLTVR